MELNEYNQKRNFDKTPEPEGKGEISDKNLRFVVQYHLARSKHYDLRLEWNGVLLSWAVPKGPSYNTGDKRLAIQVEDHPLEYRNFEGIIPRGEYGGGTVMLWDEGYWEPYLNHKVDEGLNEGMLKFELKGKRLKGKWALIRLKGKEKSKNSWIIIKEKDEYVQTDDGISEFTISIRTGRTMEEIQKGLEDKIIKNPFNTFTVQLPKLVKLIPEGEEWLYELKFDGYRIMAFVQGSDAKLITRNNNDFTSRFYSVASVLENWSKGRAIVLDGEIVITDEQGKTDFQALQNYQKNHNLKLTYIIFDILALDGEDLRNYKLIDRKNILESILKDAPTSLYYSRYVRGHGKESFAAACEMGMEGIVGKRDSSIYSGERNEDWIKIKCSKRQEFIIGGYSLSSKRTYGVSSLLLGVYEGEELIYVGRAGTGISESSMKELNEKFENLKLADPPFKEVPKAKSNEVLTWLKPELVAEIKFAEWTEENLLRQASYKGLRLDKDPKEIKREREGGLSEKESVSLHVEKLTDTKDLVIEGIKITSRDKIIYNEPLITKENVVRYYYEVSNHMLPYVRNRILSIVRCPKGVSQTCFYKKHPGYGKGIVTVSIEHKADEYFYIDSITGLISEAQMGTLEFHTWGSSVEFPEAPDILVFDLDPDEGMDLSRVRQGVLDVKSILDELKLNSYLKVSGGKGYHVVVPLKPSADWDKFSGFAKSVATVLAQKWPQRYTNNIRKSHRKDKIFIDWIRNARGATSIAPYSLRAKEGAKVSMPIDWDELNTIAPDGINIREALLRIKRKDPWGDFFNNDQALK